MSQPQETAPKELGPQQQQQQGQQPTPTPPQQMGGQAPQPIFRDWAAF